MNPLTPRGRPPGDGDELHHAIRVLARDPWGLGGAWLRSPAGPERDSVLRCVEAEGRSIRKVPAGVAHDRMLGGLDIADTLRAGRPVRRPGLIEESDGGFLAVSTVSNTWTDALAPLIGVLDRGVVDAGALGLRRARVAVLVLDEGTDEDPPPPSGLLDRLTFWLTVPPRCLLDARRPPDDPGERVSTREGGKVSDPAAVLTEVAHELGIASLRVPALALRAARASAVVRGADAIEETDILFVTRTVLAPRAAALPEGVGEEADHAPPDDDPSQAEAPEPRAESREPPPDRGEGLEDGPRDEASTVTEGPASSDDGEGEPDAPRRGSEERVSDRVLAAARAILPELREQIGAQHSALKGGAGGGRFGRGSTKVRRGRVRRVGPGDPRNGTPLDLFATLRAAAPWQTFRGRDGDGRLRVAREDFRVRHLEAPLRTATVFVVDGSGSHAVQRLAEAKGAVELYLADSYVRREEVALVVFRGREAEVVLPPTRSLARARRVLAGLPGGGGTPLAAGLVAGAGVAAETVRRGVDTRMVVLTDGKANVDLQGRGGRARAAEDARRALGAVVRSGARLLILDTSPRGNDALAALATEAGGICLRLPHVTSDAVRRVVSAAMTEPERAAP